MGTLRRLFLLWCLLPALPAVAGSLDGTVDDAVRAKLAGQAGGAVTIVTDGDTLTLADGREIRLVGIQAPKLPLGRPNFPTWPLAAEARRHLEALEHAHAQGILHRDLKPSNIVLTPAGRVVLVDFGLAFAPEDERLTRPGSWLGSLPYSSPEQLEGRRGAVAPTSDVYGLGITLIELLTLRTPYLGGDEGVVRRRVLTGHREPVRALNPSVPRGLARIAEAAADLDPARRPPTARALSEDLERFRLGRPVHARATPWWLRLGRRARRSPVITAVVLCAAAFVAGSLAFAWRERSLRTQITRLSDGAAAARLLEESESFWPPHPSKLAAMDDWLARAREVLGRREQHAATLAELRLAARPNTPGEREQDLAATEARLSTLALELAGLARYVEAGDRGASSAPPSPAEARRVVEETHALLGSDPAEFLRLSRRRIAQVRARMESDSQWEPDIGQLDDFGHILDTEEPRLLAGRVYRFPSDGDRWRHGILLGLGDRLGELEARVEEVRLHLERTRLLAGGFEADRARWDEARAAVAASPRYGGLELEPLFGLRPLGENPGSGLHEFLFLPSGEAPERTPRADDPGAFTIGSGSGVLFVLLPGGTFTMGNREAEDDPPRRLGLPLHEVELEPFLISRYELTSAQVRRLADLEPLPAGEDPREPWTSDWTQASGLLSRLGLDLPTEAQWEYAARAGQEPPATLEGLANVRDAAWLRLARSTGVVASGEEADFDDGFARAAPVGSFRPNAFGLHDVFGNVSEWCRDGVTSRGYSTLPSRPGDGLKDTLMETRRAHRGGSWVVGPAACHAGRQRGLAPDQPSNFTGVRPVIRLTHP